MKASYLSNANILKYIDSLTLRTLFVRMKILNKEERVLKTIEGRATGGSISINASSSVRRTGSITLVTGDSSYEKDEELKTLYKVTEIDNLISMNKRVEIEVGLKNTGLEYQEYDTFWIPLGQFLITNASVTHNTQGIQIQVKLTDKMGLLNGEIGGTLSRSIEISPLEDLVTGSKEASPIYNLIFETVTELGAIPANKVIIEDIDLRIPQIVSCATQQIVRYTNSNKQIIYEIADDNKEYPEDAYRFYIQEPLGYKFETFTYPGTLVANANESVASILEKIKNQLGNYEFFFDIDGNFRFQQIRNFLNEGSAHDDLTLAIADGYFINTSKGKSLYSFIEGVNLINTYSKDPQYSSIKNDYTVWGQKPGSETPLQYHLLIGNKQLTEEQKQVIISHKTFYSAPVDSLNMVRMRYYKTFEEALVARGIEFNKGTEESYQALSYIAYRWQFDITKLQESVSEKNITCLVKFEFSYNNKIYQGSRIDILNNSIKFYYQEEGEYKTIFAYTNDKGWQTDIDTTISFGHTQQVLASFVVWMENSAEYLDKKIAGNYRLYEDPWSRIEDSEIKDFIQPVKYIAQNMANNTLEGIQIYSKKITDNAYRVGYTYLNDRNIQKEKDLFLGGSGADPEGWFDSNQTFRIIMFTLSEQYVTKEFWDWFNKITEPISILRANTYHFNDTIDWDKWPQEEGKDKNKIAIEGIAGLLYSVEYEEAAEEVYNVYTKIEFDKSNRTIAFTWKGEKPAIVYKDGAWIEDKFDGTSSLPHTSRYTPSYQNIEITKGAEINADDYNWLINQFGSLTPESYQLYGVWKIKEDMRAFTLNANSTEEKTLIDSTPGFLLYNSNTREDNPKSDGNSYISFILKSINLNGTIENRLYAKSLNGTIRVGVSTWKSCKWERGEYRFVRFGGVYPVSKRVYNWFSSIADYIGSAPGNIPKQETYTLRRSAPSLTANEDEDIGLNEEIQTTVNNTELEELKKQISWDINEDILEALDWRSQRYLYAIAADDESLLGKEIIEHWPTVFDIYNNIFYSSDLLNLTYFLDMVDVNDIYDPNLEISESGKEALKIAGQFSVENIGYRRKTIDDKTVNCIFRKVPDVDYFLIPDIDDPNQTLMEQQEALELEEECKRMGSNYVPVSREVFNSTTSQYGYNAAYDLLRSQLHEFLSYNENINLTTVPVYHLDVNTRISVEDEKSDIHGDYIIQSIQIPLTINGNMTINAKRAIERI